MDCKNIDNKQIEGTGVIFNYKDTDREMNVKANISSNENTNTNIQISIGENVYFEFHENRTEKNVNNEKSIEDCYNVNRANKIEKSKTQVGLKNKLSEFTKIILFIFKFNFGPIKNLENRFGLLALFQSSIALIFKFVQIFLVACAILTIPVCLHYQTGWLSFLSIANIALPCAAGNIGAIDIIIEWVICCLCFILLLMLSGLFRIAEYEIEKINNIKDLLEIFTAITAVIAIVVSIIVG